MTSARALDLNGDVGEGCGDDAGLIPLLTSANIACGGHAGNAETMRVTVRLASRAGVAIGAHPGHADRANFGRVERPLTPASVRRLVAEQLGALLGVVRNSGAVVAHVKPHGALYHQLAREAALAEAFCDAVALLDRMRGDRGGRRGRPLLLFGPAGSALERAAEPAGLRFVAEAFADRGYRGDGSLVPRGEPGALLSDEEEAVAQALALARDGRVRAVDGSAVAVRAETLCLHGDTPHALAFARRLRSEFEAAGVALRAAALAPVDEDEA
jgi:UPF0271 protein